MIVFPLAKQPRLTSSGGHLVPLFLNPFLLPLFSISAILATDACLSGWGCVLSLPSGKILKRVSGSWSKEESSSPINLLELKAIQFSLLSLLSFISNKSIQILSDNSSSVFYLCNKGGTHSRALCKLAIDIWKFLIENNILVTIEHIRGVQNTEADFCSRESPDRNDFALSQSVFDDLISSFQIFPECDMFASRISAKLPRYVSWKSDPYSWKVDAFSFPWTGSLYFFPPINLISKVVAKFSNDNVSYSILITPAWASLPSLHSIINLLSDNPIFLPAYCVEDSQLVRRPFSWMAWPISSQAAHQLEFRKIRQLPSQKALPLALSRLTFDAGGSLLSGLLEQGISPQFPFR